MITYIPSSAPVRAKTLFASTRATLIRELGRERFEDRSHFVTEAREVLEGGWDEGGDGDGSNNRGERREEEEEEMTVAGDYGGMGGRSVLGEGLSKGGEGEKTLGLKMRMDDEARGKLGEMGEVVRKGGGDGGMVVQLVRIFCPYLFSFAPFF